MYGGQDSLKSSQGPSSYFKPLLSQVASSNVTPNSIRNDGVIKGEPSSPCGPVMYVLSCLVMSDSLQPCGLAHQAPLSTGFSRQKYWSHLLCPPPGDLPDPGIKLRLLCLLHWQLGSLPLVPSGKPVAPSYPQYFP